MNRGVVRFAHFVSFAGPMREGRGRVEGDSLAAGEGDSEGDRRRPGELARRTRGARMAEAGRTESGLVIDQGTAGEIL